MTTRAVALLASLALTALLWPPPVHAAQAACSTGSRLGKATCIQADCAELRGKARRTCRRACRAKAGRGEARSRTLAYVLSGCREDAAGFTQFSQSLRIQRGTCEPVTISFCAGGANAGGLCTQAADCPGGDCGGFLTEPQRFPRVADSTVCRLFGEYRSGFLSVLLGVLTRVAVTPDGSGVLFEVARDRGLFDPALPDGFELAEGIFFVHPDGTGLRRLRDPSAVRSYWTFPEPGSPILLVVGPRGDFQLSPDGSSFTLVDMGEDRDGTEAPQVFVVDVATARRIQLTAFSEGTQPGLTSPAFIDRDTVRFYMGDDQGTQRGNGAFDVKSDGSRRPERLQDPVLTPGAVVNSGFSVVGSRSNVLNVALDQESVTTFRARGNVVEISRNLVNEVFVTDRRNVLQLTNFQRADTLGLFRSANRRRVFFVASANIDKENPTENCQLFSIDTRGRLIRQLTHFGGKEHSNIGCYPFPPPGCSITWGGGFQTFQDPVTRAIVFESSCDPLGTGVLGSQYFAMRPDGSGLRQLTHTRGTVNHPDGSIKVELPSPWGYSALAR